MDVLAFREGRGKVEHPGTHNAHPLSAVAGSATLDLLADGSGLARADAVAADLRAALNAAFEARSTPGFAYGQSSTFCLIFGERTDDPVALKGGVRPPLASALQCAMLLEGVHLFHGCGLLSIAHGPAEVEFTAHAFTPLPRTPAGRGSHPVTHDLVVAGGHVLCPATGVDAIADVALDDGRIAVVGEGLTGRERLDAGRPPGGAGADRPARARLRRRLALRRRRRHVSPAPRHDDRASTSDRRGHRRFPACAGWSIDQAQTRVYAYLHIAVEGMISLARRRAGGHPLGLGRAVRAGRRGQPRRHRRRQAARRLPDGRDAIRAPAVGLALEAAEALGLPLMVHVIDMGMPLPELLAQHAAGRRRHALLPRQRGRACSTSSGKVWPEAFAARERGILFDVGHGVGSFTWRVARTALAQGFPPDTISSDIHAYNHAGPVHDLPRTLSKLLHLGLPLPAVIAAATVRVGEHLAHVAPAGLGTLAPAPRAISACSSASSGSFALVDGEHRLSAGVTEYARERLVARSVVRAGVVVACDEPT